MRASCLALAALLLGPIASAHAADAERQRLMILTAENPPLNFVDDGRLTGLATEVVKELARRTGTHEKIRLVEWPAGYQALSTRPGVALFSTVMTAERKSLFAWVGPLVAVETNLYALKGAKIEVANLDDARRAKKIATVTNFYSERIFKAEGFSNIASAPDRDAAVALLLNGDAELLAFSNTEMAAALERAGSDVEAVDNVFTLSTDFAYLAFSAGTAPETVARWQDALDAMKGDGSFDELYAAWLPGEVPPGVFQLLTEEYPPVTFMRDGEPAGFVTDIVRAIAERLRVRDPIRLTSWKNAYNVALVHPRVVLFSVERTPAREDLFRWVGPVGKNRAILYAKSGSGIRVKTLDDAKAVRAIATTTNWFTEQHLKREGFTNLESAPDPRTNVQQLMAGRVDLSVFTDITVDDIVRRAGFHIDDLEPLYTIGETYFYIALSRDMPDAVVDAWQAELDRLKADGVFETIYRRYLPNAGLEGLVAR
jgi:polar amino acid transport system substrate-binding protein